MLKLNRIGVILLTIVAMHWIAPASHAQDAAGGDSPLKQEELDQMLAPLALYPDSLLTQILMASTYPIEIVQADRWVKANPGLKDLELTQALEKQTWDASVKSLVNFPDVLASLSDKLEWTTKIGDAFIADQKRVLDTIQKLRDKALDQGNLKSDEQQTIVVQQQNTPTQVIVIEPTNPQVVYVPAYNPTVVYGTWWYPYYPPPVYYKPPHYPVATAAVGFGLGFACGAAWGYAWGDCDWHGGGVNIDIDRNTTINNNIDRSKYKNEINQSNLTSKDGKGKWQHDASHRKGASYRDQATASRFGGTSSRDAVQARENYRGRADAGRQDLSRGGAGSVGRTDSGLGSKPSVSDRGGTGVDSRTGAAGADRDRLGVSDRSGSASRDSAFSGSRQSGQSTRSASQRGSSSRSSSMSSGGSRGGGGGRR